MSQNAQQQDSGLPSIKVLTEQDGTGHYKTGRSTPIVMLGGPIQNAFHSSGEFNSHLRNHITALYDIISAHYKVHSAHVIEEFGAAITDLSSDKIASRDYHWMTRCDVFVAVLPNTNDAVPMRTDGTYVELGWASAMKKPILILPESQPTERSHSHLLLGLSTITRVQILPLATAIAQPETLSRAIRSCLVEDTVYL